MIIKQTLSLRQIFSITWRVDLLMLLFCAVVYFIDKIVLVKFDMPIAYPALLGTAIAFFIGFNNNQAYDRWWEARIIWGGLVNDSRSWTRNLLAYSTNMEYNHRMIRRHIAFLYATVASLRKTDDKTYLGYLSDLDISRIKDGEHIPNRLLQFQSEDLAYLYKNGCIVSDFAFHSLDMFLQSFCDELGRSERINNTVFPITYVYFTRLFIWIFIASITSSLSEVVGLYAIILGWSVGFIFNVIHLIGLELMNPFVMNSMTTPISSITRNIEINLLQMINDPNIPEPLKPIDDAYIV